MNPGTISVVLPTFNRLEYLRSSVDSVFAQTFEAWELIIADDGSDEETKTYLQSLERLPRVKLIWLPHTGNLSAVRNAGLREARGEYVAFLDSDDLWRPSKLERQIEALRKSPGRGWCYTGYVRIDGAGDVRDYPGTAPWAPHRGAIVDQLLRLEAAVATAAVLVERRLLAEVGGFDEELFIFEHYDLWLRLAFRSEVELIDEPLTCLRSHEQHYSKVGIPMLAGRRQLLRKFHGRVEDPRLHRMIGRLCGQMTLDLANLHAETNRTEALRTLLAGAAHASGNLHWWTGASRVLCKLALPRGLLAFYRGRRIRPTSVRR